MKENKTVRYLAIEDFETHGLRGSYDPMSDAVDSGYIAFWHRYGESGKKRADGGRHGLGKSTIASASRLRLFFGATVPSDSNPKQLLLQGQICLNPHQSAGPDGKPAVFDAYGLWYNKDAGGNAIPFIDKAAATFTHDFTLDRGRYPGLSLIIPFPHDDLSPAAIIKATIENYFHQVLSKHLVVEVDKVVIDASTIKDLAVRHDLPHLKAAIDLSEEVAKGKLGFFTPKAEGIKARLGADHFDDASLKQMRKRWTDGQTVAVKLPVSIRERDKSAVSGEVQLYIRREQDEVQARETYVRGRVSVPLRGVTDRSNCIGLLVADAGIASTFLGDSEPPAHNRWIAVRLRNAYIKPDEALNRIRFALRDLLSILDAGDDNRAITNAFSEFLWSTRVEEPDDPRADKVKKLKPTTDIPLPKPQPHVLKRVDGGFAYAYQASPEDDASASARIAVSYSRRASSKKSLKKAKFRDFAGEMEVQGTGAGIVDQVVEPRRIVFNLNEIGPGYELRVVGFDPNRDIELQLEAQTS